MTNFGLERRIGDPLVARDVVDDDRRRPLAATTWRKRRRILGRLPERPAALDRCISVITPSCRR